MIPETCFTKELLVDIGPATKLSNSEGLHLLKFSFGKCLAFGSHGTETIVNKSFLGHRAVEKLGEGYGYFAGAVLVHVPIDNSDGTLDQDVWGGQLVGHTPLTSLTGQDRLIFIVK